MFRPGRLEWTLSIVVHLAVAFVFWAGPLQRDSEFVYEALAINLYSPPAQEMGIQEEPPVVEEDFQQIEEIEPDPVEEPPPVIEEKEEKPPPPDPVEEKPPTPPTPPDSTEKKPVETPKSQDPDPDVEESGEDIMVKMEGIKREFPEFYNGIIYHIDRCFRWNGPDHYVATVRFGIRKEGGLDRRESLETRSGSVAFDRAAMIAVECAVTLDRIGPLPEGLDEEVLPILFTFRGSGEVFESLPSGDTR